MIFDPQNHEEFFDDLAEEGYHIFSRELAKSGRFYPNTFPAYPEIEFSDLKEDDTITIRAFFQTSKTARPTIDSGYIDLEVECLEHDTKTIWGNILTELPDAFALAKGTTIELNLDEVLSVQHR